MQTESALDMVRREAMRPLGKARDALAKAVARARLVRDAAAIGSRDRHDANAVIEDLEQVERHHDSLGGTLARPMGRCGDTLGASPQQQAEQAAPPAAPTGTPPPKITGLDRVRRCAASGCTECQSLLALLDGTDTAPVTIVAAFMRGKSPFEPAAPNGVAVGTTDRAG